MWGDAPHKKCSKCGGTGKGLRKRACLGKGQVWKSTQGSGWGRAQLDLNVEKVLWTTVEGPLWGALGGGER